MGIGVGVSCSSIRKAAGLEDCGQIKLQKHGCGVAVGGRVAVGVGVGGCGVDVAPPGVPLPGVAVGVLPIL